MKINGWFLGAGLATLIDYSWMLYVYDGESIVIEFITFMFVILFFGLAFPSNSKSSSNIEEVKDGKN